MFYKMKADYICDYLHNTGEICGKASTRPEGCRSHFNARKRRPCSVCGKPTGTTCGRCCLHIRGYYQILYVNRLRDKARQLDQVYFTGETLR